jgi:protein-disulfide isomerase
MKFNKSLLTIAVIFVCVGVVNVSKNILGPKGLLTFQAKIGPRAQGNPNAPIKIVEYMDMQCKSCAEAVPIMKNYFYTYPSKIYWEVKFYPLMKSHLYALKSALYAECAARQNKFWPFYDAVLEHQSEWSKAADPNPVFTRLALESNINIQTLEACVEDGNAKLAVMSEKDQAIQLGIKSTPTFFINEKMVVGTKALQEELDAILK